MMAPWRIALLIFILCADARAAEFISGLGVGTPPSGGITSLNTLTGPSQTIVGAAGISVSSAGSTHTITSPPVPVVQRFTASGTYTPTAGMRYVIVEAVGGGGGGGGASATVATSFSCGAAAGSGAYSKGIFSAATIGVSQTITIGAAGSVSSGGSGGTGGTTSFGSLIIVTGGVGGVQSCLATSVIPCSQSGSAGGTVTTSGGLAIPGARGGSCQANTANNFINVSSGASTPLGMAPMGGLVSTTSAIGTQESPATGFGASGTGTANKFSGPIKTGMAGTPGIVIVEEHF